MREVNVEVEYLRQLAMVRREIGMLYFGEGFLMP